MLHWDEGAKFSVSCKKCLLWYNMIYTNKLPRKIKFQVPFLKESFTIFASYFGVSQVVCGTHLHLLAPWATQLLPQWMLHWWRVNGKTALYRCNICALNKCFSAPFSLKRKIFFIVDYSGRSPRNNTSSCSWLVGRTRRLRRCSCGGGSVLCSLPPRIYRGSGRRPCSRPAWPWSPRPPAPGSGIKCILRKLPVVWWNQSAAVSKDKQCDVRQTDNSCLFYMANEKTRRSSMSADHGPVTICLLSCNSSDTQRTDATLEN